LEGALQWFCGNFLAIACVAGGNIVFDVFDDPGPPVVARDEFDGFVVSGVASFESIMVEISKFSSDFFILRHIHLFLEEY
jgi:hypothetical protein